MRRFLLGNSTALNAVAVESLQCKTPALTKRAMSTSSHVAQRWKSLLFRSQNLRPMASFSQAAASNASSAYSSVYSSHSSNHYRHAVSRKIHSEMTSKCLQIENINPNFVVMEYAVRGPLVIRAGEIEKELEKGEKKPFDSVIRANIGDSHAMGNPPISFTRQLLALCFEPKLLDSPDYAEDVKARAKHILNCVQGNSVGSYTDSAGIELIRRQVANFIEKRDGIASDYRNIMLTAGATPGIKSIISLLNSTIDGKKPGVMVPIPQYPLYSATIAEYGMEKVDYYLEEESNWGLSRKELQRSYDAAKKHCNPRALVVINPGNPTGQVLKRENIVEIIKFAYDNKLFLLADEVYQDNIWDKDSKFYSFKKTMFEMGAPYKDLEVASFMSTSKGYLGECGIRGGYMEILNLCPKVMAMLSKSITASLCGTTAGQVAVSALVNPPQAGEPSYEQWLAEKQNVLSSLKERAELIYDTLSCLKGFKVNTVQGAMYVFPQIEIPKKAIEAAKAKKMTPDTFYAFELLETAGICVVPGSGFGQKEGTYHFRTTILPQPELLKTMMNKFEKFHIDFLNKYK